MTNAVASVAVNPASLIFSIENVNISRNISLRSLSHSQNEDHDEIRVLSRSIGKYQILSKFAGRNKGKSAAYLPSCARLICSDSQNENIDNTGNGIGALRLMRINSFYHQIAFHCVASLSIVSIIA